VKKGQLDSHILVLVTLGLTAFGLVMVYSATSAPAAIGGGDSVFYLKRESIYAAIGVVFLILGSRMDYRALRYMAPPLMLASLGLCLAVCLLLLVAFSEPGEMQLGIPVTFEMTLRADAPLVLPAAVEQARIAKGSGTLIVPIGRGGFLYATVTTLIVLLAIGLWILDQLCAVFRTVRDGKPFTAANVRRMHHRIASSDSLRRLENTPTTASRMIAL